MIRGSFRNYLGPEVLKPLPDSQAKQSILFFVNERNPVFRTKAPVNAELSESKTLIFGRLPPNFGPSTDVWNGVLWGFGIQV